MNISAQFPDYEAITDDEKSRVWTTGPDRGTFYVSFYVAIHPEMVDGVYDFSETYPNALREAIAREPRIAQGKHMKLVITA